MTIISTQALETKIRDRFPKSNSAKLQAIQKAVLFTYYYYFDYLAIAKNSKLAENSKIVEALQKWGKTTKQIIGDSKKNHFFIDAIIDKMANQQNATISNPQVKKDSPGFEILNEDTQKFITFSHSIIKAMNEIFESLSTLDNGLTSDSFESDETECDNSMNPQIQTIVIAGAVEKFDATKAQIERRTPERKQLEDKLQNARKSDSKAVISLLFADVTHARELEEIAKRKHSLSEKRCLFALELEKVAQQGPLSTKGQAIIEKIDAIDHLLNELESNLQTPEDASKVTKLEQMVAAGNQELEALEEEFNQIAMDASGTNRLTPRK